MIVYEVDIAIDAAIRDEYLDWLHPHVREILALPGFEGADMLEVVEPAAEPGTARFCVRYRLADADALAAYLRDHAPRLRADGLARFGDRMRAQRGVLRPLPPR